MSEAPYLHDDLRVLPLRESARRYFRTEFVCSHVTGKVALRFAVFGRVFDQEIEVGTCDLETERAALDGVGAAVSLKHRRHAADAERAGLEWNENVFAQLTHEKLLRAYGRLEGGFIV